MTSSCTLTTDTHEQLRAHLTRRDGQEDLCFAIYRVSTGTTRSTAVLHEILLPEQPEDRHVHGNVAFTGEYFLRALDHAEAVGGGLALLHSHPRGTGWQDMSADDVNAERDHAAQALSITGLPLLGLTLAGRDAAWSARTWPKRSGECRRQDCATVRVVGDQLRITHHPGLDPVPAHDRRLLRTVSTWGDGAQAELMRLRVGIVGAGSVGSMVAEALARTGFRHIDLIDFDSVEDHNLDRLMHATAADVRAARSKVEVLERGCRRSATALDPNIRSFEHSLVEPAGWHRALDCDVLFSCVDRPLPRQLLNAIAYQHLIPVIDGGIHARTSPDGLMLGADWRAHIAGPGRRCLACLGQFEPSAATQEREGLLDNQHYINGLPADHPLRARENVFAFSMSTAAMEVLQLISMVVAPSNIADIGAQHYHAVTGEIDIDGRGCDDQCPYSGQLLARADTGPSLTGAHQAAESEQAQRRRRARTASARLARLQQGIGYRLLG